MPVDPVASGLWEPSEPQQGHMVETAAYFGDQQAKKETQREDLGCQGHVTGFLPAKCRFFLFLFWLRFFFFFFKKTTHNKTKEKRYHLEVEHGNPIRKRVPGADVKVRDPLIHTCRSPTELPS